MDTSHTSFQLTWHVYHPIRRRVKVTSTRQSKRWRAGLGEEPVWKKIMLLSSASLSLKGIWGHASSPIAPYMP